MQIFSVEQQYGSFHHWKYSGKWFTHFHQQHIAITFLITVSMQIESKFLHPMETMRSKFSSRQSVPILGRLRTHGRNVRGDPSKHHQTLSPLLRLQSVKMRPTFLQWLHLLAKLQRMFSPVTNISSAA